MLFGDTAYMEAHQPQCLVSKKIIIILTRTRARGQQRTVAPSSECQ